MRYLNNMMEQIKKLKNGVGVQSLLDSAYEIMGNPIAMFNTEYSLLAYTDVETDDPIWNELITYGTFSNETQVLFESVGFIEEVANASKSVFHKNHKMKYDRMTGKLFNKNNSHVSNLVIVASNKPFGENDQLVFEAICSLISREISRDKFYQEYEQTHQETIIKNLIDGNYDIKMDIAQVEIIYASLLSNLYVAVADVPLTSPTHDDMAHYRDLLMHAEPAYKYAIYSDCIVIIISTNDDALNVGGELGGLIKLLEQNNMCAGISGMFENLFELKKHYAEALEMLRFVSERKCAQRVFPYNPKSVDVMSKINAIENGSGIQHFLNIGPSVFGNPLLFHDMELNLLGYTENAEIKDPIWEELITYGTSSDETISLFKTTGFINTMENTKGGAFLISEKIKYDRISWRIYSNDNIMIGCLSIINSDKPFTEDELALFGAFSQKFSKEVGKIEFYNNYGQVYSETVINRLISGRIDDYTFYSEDVGNLYDSLMENLYLIVVDATKCESKYSLTYFRNLFNWKGTINRYALYSDYIVIIISIACGTLNKNNRLDEISKIFEQKNIYAGISDCFDNIYDLRGRYNEAVSLLKYGIEHNDRHNSKRIFQYEIDFCDH